MGTVIRKQQTDTIRAAVTFNFEDLRTQAEQYLERVRQQAADIVKQAQQQAQQIKQQAYQQGQQQGYQAGMNQVREMIEQKLASKLQTLMPALEQTIQQIQRSREQWIATWEKQCVHLAFAIAERILRRELQQKPEIPLEWIHESLELVTGNNSIVIKLNPQDFETLKPQVEQLTSKLRLLGKVEIIADPDVSPGGSIVETEFCTIDQQLETQLARLETELMS